MYKEQIIYEDKNIIVCYKPAGIATQTARVGERDMLSGINNYLGKPARLVHRLDQPVEGLLVFAKDKEAAADLSAQINDGRMEKYYLAALVMRRGGREAYSEPEESGKIVAEKSNNEITLINYLYKDSKSNLSRVVSQTYAGAKRAELRCEILSRLPAAKLLRAECKEKYEASEWTELEDIDIALARIKLITGRHHQIRVQMSNAGMSLLGDYKYSDEAGGKLSALLGQKHPALCAYELGFYHPLKGEKLFFNIKPQSRIFQNFSL